MPRLSRIAVVLVLAAFAMSLAFVRPAAIARPAKPAPSPSPSPTTAPTPYMPVEQVVNGTWEIILQPRGNISYSSMKLADVGTSVTGVWKYDKRTSYIVTGSRDGSHLKLDIKKTDKADAPVGSIDAIIDGIADMYGTVTLNGVDVPFTGAQHSRVPPPVEATSNPLETPTPY